MEYSVEFREQVIEKALSSGQGQEVLAEEFGIGRSTLQKWLRDYRNSGEQSLAKQEKRPADWSEEERFAAVLETAQFSEEELGRWCRAHGLHTHHLKRWGQDALLGTGGGLCRLALQPCAANNTTRSRYRVIVPTSLAVAQSGADKACTRHEAVNCRF